MIRGVGQAAGQVTNFIGGALGAMMGKGARSGYGRLGARAAGAVGRGMRNPAAIGIGAGAAWGAGPGRSRGQSRTAGAARGALLGLGVSGGIRYASGGMGLARKDIARVGMTATRAVRAGTQGIARAARNTRVYPHARGASVATNKMARRINSNLKGWR